MTGVAAIALCAAFTSCSKGGDDIYNPEAAGQMKADQITQAYNEAFIKYVGGPIASNQDWGFSSAGTRSVIKQDMTDYPSATAPDPITAKEAQWVTEWFQNNPGLTEQGQPFTNFYVQFVSGDQTNKQGVWHRYDQNRVNNGYDSNYWDEEFTENGGMDKLHCGATQDQGSTDHLLDFNAKTGGPWDIVYIKDGSALQWGYHSSWGEDSKAPAGDGYYWYFKMVELTVPGSCFDDNQPRTGWYVGLSLYGKKYDNGDKELGYQRLQYAEDWIVKVVPGETTPPPTHNYTLRVLGEDLTFGEDADADFDFNDVVFDVAIENGETWIRLQAAGGTLPLYIDTKEVHALFGLNNTTTMVNTGRGSRLDPVEVKLDHYYANAKDIPVTVTKNGTTIALRAERGEPASKIAVNNMSFQWCAERVSMKQQYPLFTEWCTNNSFTSVWWAQ